MLVSSVFLRTKDIFFEHVPKAHAVCLSHCWLDSLPKETAGSLRTAMQLLLALSLSKYQNHILRAIAAMSGVRHDQPRSPYDQFCFELLEKFRKDLPYYTNGISSPPYDKSAAKISCRDVGIALARS